MLDAYREMERERAKAGLPPLPLAPAEVEEICRALETADPAAGAPLRALPENRVSPGVDPGAKVKAEWLAAVAQGRIKPAAVSREDAVRVLGTMLGGYNVGPLGSPLQRDGRRRGGRGPEEDHPRLRPFRGRGRAGSRQPLRQVGPRVVGAGGVVTGALPLRRAPGGAQLGT